MEEIPDRGTRSQRTVHVEFAHAKEKEDFQEKCYREGRTLAKVIKTLARMYVQNKIKLD